MEYNGESLQEDDSKNLQLQDGSKGTNPTATP